MSEKQTLYLRQQISRNGWRKREPLDDDIDIESPQLINQALEIYGDKIYGDPLQTIAGKLRVNRNFLSELLFYKENKKEGKNFISLL